MAQPAMNMFDTHKSIKALIEAGVKEKEAESIVDLVSVSREYDFSRLATKEQVNSVAKDVQTLEKEMKAVEENLTNKFKTEVATVKAEIATLKWDVLKWIIPFFLTNSIAIVALIAAFFVYK